MFLLSSFNCIHTHTRAHTQSNRTLDHSARRLHWYVCANLGTWEFISDNSQLLKYLRKLMYGNRKYYMRINVNNIVLALVFILASECLT